VERNIKWEDRQSQNGRSKKRKKNIRKRERKRKEKILES